MLSPQLNHPLGPLFGGFDSSSECLRVNFSCHFLDFGPQLCFSVGDRIGVDLLLDLGPQEVVTAADVRAVTRPVDHDRGPQVSLLGLVGGGASRNDGPKLRGQVLEYLFHRVARGSILKIKGNRG